jgi:hypothetical protein
MGNPEPRGHLGAGAVVAVEELQDPGRLTDARDALVEPVDIDRIDDPDAIAEAERMAGALHHLIRVRQPGDPEVVVLEAR